MEIIDNVNKTLKDDLLVTLCSGSKVAIAASCFSIFRALTANVDLYGSEFEIKIRNELPAFYRSSTAIAARFSATM